MRKFKYILILYFLSFVFTQDVLLTLDGQSLNYVTSSNIAGWQFNHDGCASSSNGGDSTDNGFTISCSEEVCLSFSFTGSTIPIGSGTLIELLPGLCTENSFSEWVFSGTGGTTLLVDFSTSDDTILEGCTDSNACNYNLDAIADDGSCLYAEENFDCNGNCIADIDECGICGGDGLSCQNN